MPLFKHKTITSVEELAKRSVRSGGLQRWAYRGHSCPKCGVSSTFERACDARDVPAGERPDVEVKLVREFARKAHLHLAPSELPAPDDTLEWLSLMQHHGAPTRLVDWTYSLPVALFFAHGVVVEAVLDHA